MTDLRQTLAKRLKPQTYYTATKIIEVIGIGHVKNRVRLFQEAKALGYLQEGLNNTFRINQ